MAVLRQVAFVPAVQELAILGNLSGPIQVWQRPKIYGNFPTDCYLNAQDGKWFLVKSQSNDVAFKFEAIYLTIQAIVEIPDTREFKLVDSFHADKLVLLFRSEWRRPNADEGADKDWDFVIKNPAFVDEAPTRKLLGALTLFGLKFELADASSRLIHLDNFPLSIRYESNAGLIGGYLDKCRAVPGNGISDWISALKGWEIKVVDAPE